MREKLTIVAGMVDESGISAGYIQDGEFHCIYAARCENKSDAEAALLQLTVAIDKTLACIAAMASGSSFAGASSALLPIGISVSGQNGRIVLPADFSDRLSRQYCSHFVFVLNDLSAAACYYGSKAPLAGRRFLLLHIGENVDGIIFDGRTYRLFPGEGLNAGALSLIKVRGNRNAIGNDSGCNSNAPQDLSAVLSKRGLCAIVRTAEGAEVEEDELLLLLEKDDRSMALVLDAVADCISQVLAPLIIAIGLEHIVITVSPFCPSGSDAIAQALPDVLLRRLRDYVGSCRTLPDDFLIYCVQEEEYQKPRLIGLYSYYLSEKSQKEGVYPGMVLGQASVDVSLSRKTAFSIVRVNSLLDAREILCRYIGAKRVLIVIDDNLLKIVPGTDALIKKAFDGMDYSVLPLAPSANGAEKKDLSSLLAIVNGSIEADLSRDSILIAIGGGVIMDLVGFAAQQYRRMLPYYRIPTTLVGQIDAGIGIKVGIDYNEHKNLLGAFYPPRLVINCSDFLFSLNEANFACGISEILKVGITDCARIINILLEQPEPFTPLTIASDEKTFKAFQTVMDLAIQTMLSNLHSNIFEENELRRKMDFGHSFSPAIEGNSRYQIPHGYAVAMDIALSVYISFRFGLISSEVFEMYWGLLEQYRLLVHFTAGTKSFEKLFDSSLDSLILHRAGNLNLVLPTGIGESSFLNLEECMDKSCECYALIMDRVRLKGAVLSGISYLNKRLGINITKGDDGV